MSATKIYDVVLEGPEVEWAHREAPEYYKRGVVTGEPRDRRKVVKPHIAVVTLEAGSEEEARFVAKQMNPDYASFAYKSVRVRER